MIAAINLITTFLLFFNNLSIVVGLIWLLYIGAWPSVVGSLILLSVYSKIIFPFLYSPVFIFIYKYDAMLNINLPQKAVFYLLAGRFYHTLALIISSLLILYTYIQFSTPNSITPMIIVSYTVAMLPWNPREKYITGFEGIMSMISQIAYFIAIILICNKISFVNAAPIFTIILFYFLYDAISIINPINKSDY